MSADGLFCATGIVEAYNIDQTALGDLDRWIAVLERALKHRTIA